MTILPAACLAAAALSAWASGPFNVFGENDRKPYPASAEETASRLTGALLRGGEAVCTAFLAGPDVILTAGHCVAVDGALVFELPDVKDGAQISVAAGAKILAKGSELDATGEGPQHDWAALLLDAPLGRERGWFKLGRAFGDSAEKGSDLAFAGRSEAFGKGRTIQRGCSRRGWQPRPLPPSDIPRVFTHDCDVSIGDSGGPLWLNRTSRERHPILVGIQSTERIDPENRAHRDAIKEQGHLSLAEYHEDYSNAAVDAGFVHQQMGTREAFKTAWEKAQGAWTWAELDWDKILKRAKLPEDGLAPGAFDSKP